MQDPDSKQRAIQAKLNMRTWAADGATLTLQINFVFSHAIFAHGLAGIKQRVEEQERLKREAQLQQLQEKAMLAQISQACDA